jgi:hypothetical protein
MSEQILNRFFVVFYKNLDHFKSSLGEKDWNDFLKETEISIDKFQAGEKTNNDVESLRNKLKAILRNYNFESAVQNLLDSVITKAAETKQKEPRPVKSVQNSIGKIAKKIKEEKKSQDSSKHGDKN